MYIPVIETNLDVRDKSRAGMACVHQEGLARMFRHSITIYMHVTGWSGIDVSTNSNRERYRCTCQVGVILAF